MTEKRIKRISIKDLWDAYFDVNGQEWYKTNLDILKYFINLYPKNDNPYIVAVKVALIDSTNSTHFSTQQGNKKNGVTLMQFAQNIVDCNFDKRIKTRDPQLVTDISKGLGTNNKGWGRNFFSLATKYCHYHNRLLKGIPEKNRYEYPIYDSNVCENIPKYINGVVNKDLNDLKTSGDYEKFNEIIEKILKKNHITKKKMPLRKVALDCLLYNSGSKKKGKKKNKKNK